MEGTYTNYENLDEKLVSLHDYLKYVKYGFGRATDHVCIDIRNNRMTREEALKIVKQLWRFEDQSKNSSELATRASKIHTKLRNFVKDIEKVGFKLSEAEISYKDAMKKLTEGQGNLISQAREFEKLGVAVKEDFSEEIVVKSELGLKAEPETKKVL